jgi:DNA-directed RNA polymerase specialized sigma24 family protein
MNPASLTSTSQAAHGQIFERKREELLWLAESMVGDPLVAEECVAAAMLRADSSAYVAPNWHDVWIKRCVVREAIERNRAEIKRIATNYLLSKTGSNAPNSLDKQSFRCLPAIKISTTLSVFERAALILHQYLGFSAHDCALLVDCHWSVIEPACSNAAWRIFAAHTNTPNEAAKLGLSEVVA